MADLDLIDRSAGSGARPGPWPGARSGVRPGARPACARRARGLPAGSVALCALWIGACKCGSDLPAGAIFDAASASDGATTDGAPLDASTLDGSSAADAGGDGAGDGAADDGGQGGAGADGSVDDAGPGAGDGGGAGAADGGTRDGGPTIDLGHLTWAIQIMIEPAATVLGSAQTTAPRSVRGLALSPDSRYLYAGYNNGSQATAEVRQIDLRLQGDVAPFVAHRLGVGSKALAVDDQGRVYVAGDAQVTVLTSSLTRVLFTIGGLTACEGVAVARESGALILYSSDRMRGTLERRRVTEAGPAITAASLDGFGGTGSLTLDGSPDSLRNVRIDPRGRIWVASYRSNRIYRLEPDGSGLVHQDVSQPFDLGFDGDQVIVSHGTALNVTVLDFESMQALGTFQPAWAGLGLVPAGAGGQGSLSGLVVLPASGLYLANETGTTTATVSPHGDDPILWAHAP